MATGTVSQSVARPVRTAAQMVPSLVVTEFIDAFVYNLNDKQYAALAAILLLVFGFIQAHIEDVKGVGFFRSPNGEHVKVVEKDKWQAR